jgi:hypothetical protein
MAQAVIVMQPPGTGKTLKTRPAFKGMLRNKVPEMCAIGALARWLVVRIALQAEAIPKPGSRAWKKFFLWYGRAGAVHSCIWNLALLELSVTMRHLAGSSVSYCRCSNLLLMALHQPAA